MTLVDSRPGIRAALTSFRAETGVPIDVEAVLGRLGPPVQTELLPLVGAAGLPEALTTFRRHMAEVGVQGATAMPGAVDALDAVGRLGMSSLVVTAKHRPLALSTLHYAGLEPDLVAGDVFAEAKAEPLREWNAVAYVGDHTADMTAARAAGVLAVAVATGPISADDLAAAGADVVLADLTELPATLARWA